MSLSAADCLPAGPVAIRIAAANPAGVERVLYLAEPDAALCAIIQMLPVHRRSGMPILKGLGTNPTHERGWLDLPDARRVPVKFGFTVPEAAVAADLPELLRRWRDTLELTRVNLLGRPPRRRSVSAPAAPGAPTDVPAPPVDPGTGSTASTIAPVALAGCANDAGAAPCPHDRDAGAEPPGLFDDIADDGAHNQPPAPPPGAQARTAAANSAVYAAAPGALADAASPAPTCLLWDSVALALPLLQDVTLAAAPLSDAAAPDVAGDAYLVVGARTWDALVVVDDWSESGPRYSRLDLQLDALWTGSDADRAECPDPDAASWRELETMEDVAWRVTQACAMLDDAHAQMLQGLQDLKAVQLAQRKVARTSSRAGTPRRAPSRPQCPEHLHGSVDLARMILVDQALALMVAPGVLHSQATMPDWAVLYAKTTECLAADLEHIQGCTDVAVRMRTFAQWAYGLQVLQDVGQGMLWSEPEHQRLQRGCAPHVLRAQRWAQLLDQRPILAAAALSVLAVTR